MEIRRPESVGGYVQSMQASAPASEPAGPPAVGLETDRVQLGARPGPGRPEPGPAGQVTSRPETALPSSASPPPPSPERARSDAVLARGEALALEVLKRDTHLARQPGEEQPLSVLAAGGTHFEALWTRDACWGCLGLLASGRDPGTVRDTLEALLNRQRPTGEMPRRQGNHSNLTAMIGDFLHLPLRNCDDLDQVEFRNERDACQYDGNALPLIAAAEYASQTGDTAFLKENYQALTRAADWLQRQDEEWMRACQQRRELIDQNPSSDWKDVVGRHGVVAYTNAVAYQGHRSMAAIDRLLGNPEKADQRETFAGVLKRDFNTRLWDEKAGYYRDSEADGRFSPDGNILALVYGLAEGRRAERVLQRLDRVADAGPLPFQAAEENYPESYVPLWLRAAGLGHYHDAMVWPWQGAAFSVAAARHGRPDMAREALEKMAAAADRDGTFYEIYTPGGDPRPVRTWAYESERDFLWSAGTYLWALKELRQAEGTPEGSRPAPAAGS